MSADELRQAHPYRLRSAEPPARAVGAVVAERGLVPCRKRAVKPLVPAPAFTARHEPTRMSAAGMRVTELLAPAAVAFVAERGLVPSRKRTVEPPTSARVEPVGGFGPMLATREWVAA